MDNKLSTDVQMQFLRPVQLEKRGRDFPVVYVPFGLIEWHGPQLPLGNDALKAHAILVKAAELYGGTVYPPVWFHENFGQEIMVPVLQQLFERLKKTGYRVIIGVSGHNVREQINMINDALKPVVSDGTVAGFGMYEMTLSRCDDSNTDHAAKWETSNMMFFYPELVDMGTIEGKDLTFNMEPSWGIDGLDPRKYANAEVGRLNCRLCAESIGKKAKELLESLPPAHRNFNMEKLEPANWWFV